MVDREAGEGVRAGAQYPTLGELDQGPLMSEAESPRNRQGGLGREAWLQSGGFGSQLRHGRPDMESPLLLSMEILSSLGGYITFDSPWLKSRNVVGSLS